MLPAELRPASVMPLHPHPIPVWRPPSLSADFFARQSTADRSRDSLLSAQRRRLQQALTMPAEHRWVADWLFVDADDAFHRNIPLPPEAFRNTLAVKVNHQFTEIEVPNMCPVMQRAHSPGNRCPVTGNTIASNPHHRSSSFASDLLLVPVASLDGITVGYAFGATDGKSAGGDTRAQSSLCGRFAFNSAVDDLLIVVNGAPPGAPPHCTPVTVLMTVRSIPGKEKREHLFFMCPKLEYGFEHLPSQILSVVSAEGTLPEHTPETPALDVLEDLLAVKELDPLSSGELHGYVAETAPPPPRLLDVVSDHGGGSALLSWSSNDSSSAPDSDDTLAADGGGGDMEFVESLLADMRAPEGSARTCSATRSIPWETGGYGATSDGVGIPRVPGRSGTSSGAFELGALCEALGGIEANLRGSFTTMKMREAGMDTMTGRWVTGALVRVVAQLERVDEGTEQMLQRQAATLYFAAATAVRADEGRFGVGVVGRVGLLGAGDGVREREREERREAKKRRNRMSAARSNQRRKEMLEMRKKEMEELRTRARELEEKRERLRGENQELKERLLQ